MKIGMMTGLWHIAEGLGVLDSLERVAALGFTAVDLHGVFHAGPAHLNDAQRAVLEPRMDALGLEPRNYVLHALHNIPSATPAEIEASYRYLCEGIDMAQEWGINQLMLNAGQWAFGVSREEAWERAVSFIRRVCEYAAARGVFIAQEAEPYVWFLVHDATSTARMMADVDQPNFTTLVDLGHMALAREDVADLAPLGDSIIHAHFSDHEPHRHTNQVIGTGFTPTVTYLAGLNALEIDSRMSRFGYDELVISFELGVPGDIIDDPDLRARQSLRYVQEAAPFLTM